MTDNLVPYLAPLIFVGGLLHFGTLTAGVLLPRVLHWRTSLQKLDTLSREVIWVHHFFLGIVIVSFGAMSVLFAGTLADGAALARALCLVIALFWAGRLLVQFFVFDARPHLKTALLKAGYNGLTVVFTYQAVVYGLAALLPR